MAFPTILGVRHTHVTANAASIDVLLPDGSNVVGRLIVIFVTMDGSAGITWAAIMNDITNANGVDGSSSSRSAARYRVIDGTEGFDGVDDIVNVAANSGSEEFAATAFLIKDHAASTSAPECAAATGTTGNMDPANLAPSWGALDTLWIAYGGLDASVNVTGWPTNYADNQHGDNTGGTGGVSHGVATRNLNATSDNPGTFTNDNESWRALTLAVRPGSEGSSTPQPPRTDQQARHRRAA